MLTQKQTATIFNKVITLGSGLILMLTVALLLDTHTQGIYFTTVSLLSAQIFADMGITFALITFLSHESSKIDLKNRKFNFVKDYNPNNILYILKFSKFWFKVFGVILAISLLIIGLLLFKGESIEVKIIYGFLCLNLYYILQQQKYIILLEGINKNEIAHNIKSISLIISSVCFFVCVILKLELASLLISQVCFMLAMYIGTSKTLDKRYLQNLMDRSIRSDINWKTDIFPFQSKIAISSICGFVTFQFYVPITYSHFGAVEAGKLGLSLQLCSAISSVASFWFVAELPFLGSLVGTKRIRQAQLLVLNVIKKSLFSYVMLSVCFVLSWWPLKLYLNDIADRMISDRNLILLIISFGFSTISIIMAQFVRLKKTEPFMRISIINASLTCLLLIFIGNEVIEHIIMIHLISNVAFAFFPILLIFLRSKNYEK